MLADIWSNPDFGEVCFLIAFILFAIEFIIRLVRPANWPYDLLMLVAGLAFVALGLLALDNGADGDDAAAVPATHQGET